MTATGLGTVDRIKQSFPKELQARSQWVMWKYEQRKGEKKPTKVPYDAKTGARAKSETPSTWAAFDVACKAFDGGGYDGVGFVVTDDDPYCGIDLDGCIVAGQLSDNALRWIESLDSYTEVSPSKAGVRIWVRGVKPGKKCKNAKLGVEIYQSERFFTVTGNRLDALPMTVNDRQSELDALYHELFPAKAPPAGTGISSSTPSLSIDDQELIERLCRKAGVQALWNGDTSNYAGDHSNADLALCNELAFYTRGDAARMDRLFRQSGLMRPKWDRQDYRDRTISKAIDDCRNSYDPVNHRNGQASGYVNGASSTAASAQQTPTDTPTPPSPSPAKVWSVAALLCAEFPEPKWAVPGLLPAGLVVLAGRPKLGKSWLALQIAVAVGTGGVVLTRQVEKAKVLYLALEDNPRRIQDRLGKQQSPANAAVDFHFEWPALVDKQGKVGTDLLVAAIGAVGYKLVIIDTISRALGHADQLDQADMNVAFGALQRLAMENEVCLLLVDHHRKSAGGVGDVIDDVMGATSKVGVADAAIGIYRQRGQPEATLKVSGRDVDDQELIIKFDRELFCWQLVGDAGDVKANSAQADVMMAIEEMGGTATITRIAKWLGKQAPNVAREVGELVARGKLIKGAKQGKEVPYLLPQASRSNDDNNDNNDNHDNHDNHDNYHWSDR